MDIVERLTLESPPADARLPPRRRLPYELAARLCAGQRVLDLCCGTGHGSRLLAGGAAEVLGVDNDAAMIEAASDAFKPEVANLAFAVANPIDYIASELGGRFDVVVCLGGLEERVDLAPVLEGLAGHAERGLRLIVALPKDSEWPEGSALPDAVLLAQFLAEGALIRPPGATEGDFALRSDDDENPRDPDCLIAVVGFRAELLRQAHHDRIQLDIRPGSGQEAELLRGTVAALRRENARLARARLGKGGSAAATLLHRHAAQEARIADLAHRNAEQVRELQELRAEVGSLVPPADRTLRWSNAVPVVGSATTVKPQPVPVAPGENPNTWEHRRRRAAEVLIPWIEQTIPLAGKTVLEYGCGNAAVSCAVGERAQRLIGLDIGAGWIEAGRAEVRARGLRNVELEHHPVESILDAFAARRGEIDVILLYAVLEHLTIDERLKVLGLARDVVSPDGAIVVCEAPNRLIYFDHHTAKMPFFGLLPPDLVAHYYPRSNRDDFTAALGEAEAQGPDALAEAIIRWGRGVSYHEFELVFGELSQHVIASNYDTTLFGERPIQPDEVILSRYLDRWRPDLAPVWSRYWLDLILSPQPVRTRGPFLRPWSADTLESEGAAWTREECVRLRGPDAVLWVNLPNATRRVVVGSGQRGGRELGLYLRPDGIEQPLVAHIDAAAGPAFTTFELPEPASRFALQASDACELPFIGYDC